MLIYRRSVKSVESLLQKTQQPWWQTELERAFKAFHWSTGHTKYLNIFNRKTAKITSRAFVSQNINVSNRLLQSTGDIDTRQKSISVYNHIIYGLIIHYIKYPNLTVFHKQVANKII